MTKKIFVIHGVMSKSENLAPLATALTAKTSLRAQAIGYNWKRPILEAVPEVFDKICEQTSDEENEIVLVGHSQGGIVCRVLAVLMTGLILKPNADPERSNYPVRSAYRSLNLQKQRTRKSLSLKGVVTLASPNSGALTYGQLSATATLVAKTTKGVASAFGIDNIHDMTTDQVPRLLQFFNVPNVKYLSVSGSKVNRYTLAYDDLVSNGISALIPNFSVRLQKPNDLLIEEESADLTRLLLPFEGQEAPEHLNSYIDCSDVYHTSIHSNRYVQDSVAKWILSLP